MGSDVTSLTVGIPVTDMTAAVAWYRTLLGAGEECEVAPGIMEFQLFSTGWLQLIQSEQGVPLGGVVRFGVGDIEKQHSRLQALGIQVQPIGTVPGVVCYFDFQDPFGNRLCFYEQLE